MMIGKGVTLERKAAMEIKVYTEYNGDDIKKLY